jgi:hypothetical protein
VINTITAEIDKWAKKNDVIRWSTASLDELENAYHDIDDGKQRIKDICRRIQDVVEVELNKMKEDMARIESRESLSSQSCRELIRSEVEKENGAIHRLVGKMVHLELGKRDNNREKEVTEMRKDMVTFRKKINDEQKSIRERIGTSQLHKPGPRAGQPPANAQFDQLNHRLQKMEQELHKAKEVCDAALLGGVNVPTNKSPPSAVQSRKLAAYKSQHPICRAAHKTRRGE